jgi:hypothetical protein
MFWVQCEFRTSTACLTKVAIVLAGSSTQVVVLFVSTQGPSFLPFVKGCN